MSLEGKIKFALCEDKVSKVKFFWFITYFWLVRYHVAVDVAVGVVKLFGLCCVPILVCLIFVFVWGVIIN